MKKENIRHLQLFQSQRKLVEKELWDQGIEVLDDLTPLYSEESQRRYLKYHYGNEVNVTDLMLNHRAAYLVIQNRGAVRDVIASWGFRVVYEHLMTDDMLKKELAAKADENRKVKLSRKLYGALLYRANQRGISLVDLVEELGYSYKPRPVIDTAKVRELRDEQKKSFSEIAEALGISRASAHNHYKKATQELKSQ
ncbi:hypothetical protein ACP26L_35985 (plasmid) [Paenibacillus sp. S-38]|uniref:hypothetical protein n=1 Tax=Paenibacillus sp. S-38 TaxID=3416710 RepID=UPI003CEF5AC2